jgi:sterol desaturase/sphingolipid hydroxylase (fatty acid hydroxylase superfamily)
MTWPAALLILTTAAFLCVERISPGRALPHVPGWYFRALLINAVQLGITLSLARTWIGIFGAGSIFSLSSWNIPALEGFAGWFIGTFIFYWWHRLRHAKGFWRVFHQVHHSPSRIEVLTSFYKHPVEILANSFLSAFILFPVLGCSMLGTFWYNFFAATGEYFYHANFKSPKLLRYFIQTPELHSVHHQLNVHDYNYADLPVWDRIFGTYRDTTEFMPECGFPEHGEERVLEMIAFKDVYETSPS